MEHASNSIDPLAAGMLWMALDNAFYTVSIFIGFVFLVVGSINLATNSSARWHSLGVGLMSFGLGIAGPGIFNIMFAIDGASRDPLPSWLMWFIAVGIPLWGCAGGGFGIYRFIMLGKTATSQAVTAARRDDCP